MARATKLRKAWRRPERLRVTAIRDRLRAAYGRPELAPHGAPLDEVEEAIRPGGISRIKAGRIQAILRALDGDDLAWLETAPVENGRSFLCALPGVGRKTAACVLLFSYGLPDIPVDTHVYRVGTRLGLFRPGAPFDEAHDELLALADPEDAYELHVSLIRHGRRTCNARAPRCGECPLLDLCPEGQRRTAAASK